MGPLNLLIVLAVIIDVCICQTTPQLFVKIGEGEECTGKSGSLSAHGIEDMQIEYNLTAMYNETGYKVLVTSGISKMYRMSICGRMTGEDAKCGTPEDDDWCFEETTLNGNCLKGIADWRQNTQSGSIIVYDAMCYVYHIIYHVSYIIRTECTSKTIAKSQ